MFKIFVTIDKHQRFKSFIRETRSIKLEHSSSNAENAFVSNLKIADYFFKLPVTIICKPTSHCAGFNLKWNEQWCQHSWPSVSWTNRQWLTKHHRFRSLSFFTSIWWITV